MTMEARPKRAGFLPLTWPIPRNAMLVLRSLPSGTRCWKICLTIKQEGQHERCTKLRSDRSGQRNNDRYCCRRFDLRRV